MNDYRPDPQRFNKQNPEKKKLEKVVRGNVKLKKKSELSKFTDIFIAEDVKSVGSYAFMEVLVPAIKKAVVDIVTDGINMIFYGGTERGRKSSSSKVSYRSYYDSRDDRRPVERTRTGYAYDDIVLPSRGEAEEVLEQLDNALDMYKVVSVADLYDLIGESCPHTAHKYGWTNLRNARAVKVRDGYLLELPKALPIN